MMIQRLGSRMSLVLSLVLSGVGILLLMGGQHPFWFWLSMIVYGLAGGFNGPAVGAYTIEVLPRNQYGQGMGLQRTISDVGYVAGPVVIGLVSDWSSIGNSAGLMACSALIGNRHAALHGGKQGRQAPARMTIGSPARPLRSPADAI